MSEHRRLYNVAEAAVECGVGQTKIRQEITAGRLIARRVGKLFLITSEDLASWIDNLPRVAA
jgi:excisionase family DNA binding protein